MEEQTYKKTFKERFWNFHDKHYKSLLLIPIMILVLSFVYIGFFYSHNHDFIYKDVSLTGGTSVTIFGQIDANQLKQNVSGQLDGISTNTISDLVTKQQNAIVISTKSDANITKSVLESYLGYTLNSTNSNFEFTGALLSGSFYQQLLTAVLAAFILMALVIFIIFRNPVPSMAVIISAFADIFMTLIVVDVLGIRVSSAGIVAFLMLIGYSVDTDILLTNRVLKVHEGQLNEKIAGAFKTGITMTLTAFASIFSAFIITSSFSSVLTQIFTILLIGFVFDIINTWITNVSLIKWYVLSKK